MSLQIFAIYGKVEGTRLLNSELPIICFVDQSHLFVIDERTTVFGNLVEYLITEIWNCIFLSYSSGKLLTMKISQKNVSSYDE